MSWHFSQALGAAYSRANCSDGAPWPPSSSMPFAADESCSAKMKNTFHLSPFGMMFAPSTDTHGAALLTWFLAGFPVKISALPEKVMGSTGNALDYGGKCAESLAKFCPISSLWKTRQLSLFGGLEPFSETWPQWGMMLDGELLAQTMPVFPSIESGSGFWASPAARDWKDSHGMARTREKGRHRIDQLARQVYASLDGSGLFTPPTATLMESALSVEMILAIADARALPWTSANMEKWAASSTGEASSGLLNPDWVEWLMGWPVGWTASKPLAMDRCRMWRGSHGKYSEGRVPDESSTEDEHGDS